MQERARLHRDVHQRPEGLPRELGREQREEVDGWVGRGGGLPADPRRQLRRSALRDGRYHSADVSDHLLKVAALRRSGDKGGGRLLYHDPRVNISGREQADTRSQRRPAQQSKHGGSSGGHRQSGRPDNGTALRGEGSDTHHIVPAGQLHHAARLGGEQGETRDDRGNL